MSFTQQIAKSIYEDLIKTWGREPSWEEFIQASKENKVQVNKTIAAQSISLPGMPLSYIIVYGILTLGLGYFIVPITILLSILGIVKFWWIFIAFAISRYLIEVSRHGHCEGIKIGAEKNKYIYERLMKSGAFFFKY